MTEKKLESRYYFRGRIVNLRVDRVELPDGKEATREVVEHPGAVAVVALSADREVVLIRQYRTATGETMWEIPAGKLEKGEDPKTCANRELLEETGYKAGSMELLISFFTTPGFSSEILHLYLAQQLKPGPQNLEADEIIDTHLFTLSEALKLVEKGEIRDGKTIIGLLLAEKKLNSPLRGNCR